MHVGKLQLFLILSKILNFRWLNMAVM